MSDKLYKSSKDKSNTLWGINKYINNDRAEVPSDIPNNEIDQNRNKSREQQRKWHTSKLEGYVSDEFRNIEFAD